MPHWEVRTIGKGWISNLSAKNEDSSSPFTNLGIIYGHYGQEGYFNLGFEGNELAERLHDTIPSASIEKIESSYCGFFGKDRFELGIKFSYEHSVKDVVMILSLIDDNNLPVSQKNKIIQFLPGGSKHLISDIGNDNQPQISEASQPK